MQEEQQAPPNQAPRRRRVFEGTSTKVSKFISYLAAMEFDVQTGRKICEPRVEGVPGDLVKEWIGHSSLRTTSRYTHLRPEFWEQVAAEVGLFKPMLDPIGPNPVVDTVV